MPKLKPTTTQKLQRTNAAIRRWETKLKRAATALTAYRAVRTRQERKQAEEQKEQVRALTDQPRRHIDLSDT